MPRGVAYTQRGGRTLYAALRSHLVMAARVLSNAACSSQSARPRTMTRPSLHPTAAPPPVRDRARQQAAAPATEGGGGALATSW